MVRKAQTPEEKKKCREYLRKFQLESPTDLFLYVETDTDQTVIAAAGITIGLCDEYKIAYIEPYRADDNISNLKLYCSCEGYLLANGVKYSVVGCEANKTTENMYAKIGYKPWSKNMNQYIKKL